MLDLGQHGTSRQSVIRVDGGQQPALLVGGRQMNEKRTERRQELEREMHERENWLKTWNPIRENLGGGREGSTRTINGREK